MGKRVILCAGGTAGHLYPAQALADALLRRTEAPELLFAGSGLADSPFFARSRYAWCEIPSSSLSVRHPVRSMGGAARIVCGLWHAHRLLDRFVPDLIVGFGSYHALPPLLAARRRGLPYLLHEGNAIPGRVTRLLANEALVTGLQFASASSYLSGPSECVGVPLRQPERSERRDWLLQYGLEVDRTTLLIFGGSQGARRVNELVAEAVVDWRGLPVQALHMTGDPVASERLRAAYAKAEIPARVVEFESRMPRAWECADLAISRAGAATVAEMVAWGVPALLIPYPYAADNHQWHNARYLEMSAGAQLLPEKGLTAERLSACLRMLLANGGEELAQRRERMEWYRRDQRDVFAERVAYHLGLEEKWSSANII